MLVAAAADYDTQGSAAAGNLAMLLAAFTMLY